MEGGGGKRGEGVEIRGGQMEGRGTTTLKLIAGG